MDNQDYNKNHPDPNDTKSSSTESDYSDPNLAAFVRDWALYEKHEGPLAKLVVRDNGSMYALYFKQKLYGFYGTMVYICNM
jgi:hypothetical protein